LPDGCQGYAEVYVQKDITAPNLLIIEPDSGDKFPYNPPIFNIQVTDIYLDSIWYTLNGGITNFTITGFSPIGVNDLWETTDETFWNGLPNGNILVEIYVQC